MKTPDRPHYSDEQVDRLLAGKLRDTTPEFEARWVALKRELRQQPARRRSVWNSWNAWFGALAAGAALAVAVVAVRRPAVVEPGTADAVAAASTAVSPQALEELFAMDAVLTRARVLLDDENRAALLHLPADNTPKT